jgi:hypothetical protein
VAIQKRHLTAHIGVGSVFEILDVVGLRLRSQKRFRLDLDRKLPFLNGQQASLKAEE